MQTIYITRIFWTLKPCWYSNMILLTTFRIYFHFFICQYSVRYNLDDFSQDLNFPNSSKYFPIMLWPKCLHVIQMKQHEYLRSNIVSVLFLIDFKYLLKTSLSRYISICRYLGNSNLCQMLLTLRKLISIIILKRSQIESYL